MSDSNLHPVMQGVFAPHMPQAADWSEVGAEVSAIIAEAIEPKLKTAADEIYDRLLYGVQEYLVENTLFNIGSELDAARRQSALDRQAALRAQLQASVLFEALNRLTGSAKTVRAELAADGIQSAAFDECIAAAEGALKQGESV